MRNFKSFTWVMILAISVLVSLVIVQLFWIRNTMQLYRKDAIKKVNDLIIDRFRQVEYEAYYISLMEDETKRTGKEVGLNAEKSDTNSIDKFSDTLVFLSKKSRRNQDSIRGMSFPPATEIKGMTNLAEGNSQTFLSAILGSRRFDTLIQKDLKAMELNDLEGLGIKPVKANYFSFIKAGTDTANLNRAGFSSEIRIIGTYKTPHLIEIVIANPVNFMLGSIFPVLLGSVVFTISIIGVLIFFVINFYEREKLSEMKSVFVNNMTHEFKTPITNISLAIEHLLNTGNMDKKYLSIISEENTQMGRNLERILQSSRLSKNKGSEAFELVDIHEVILKVIESFGLRLNTTSSVIHCDLDAIHFHLYGDETHFINLFYNLIDNAIKYSRKNPEIRICTSNESNRLKISIQDNGIGMSEYHKNRIFNKFYRVPTGSIHNVHGFGLGLSYVKSIVELHKGEIAVESKEENGSVFNLSFNLT